MHRYVPALLLLCGANAFADSPAVEGPNYELAIGGGDTYVSGDRDSSTYALAGAAHVPIADYLGLSLNGSYARTSLGRAYFRQTAVVSTTRQPPTARTNTGSADIELFARDPGVGKVGLRYGTSRLRSEGDAIFISTGDGSLATTSYAGVAEYYVSRITLAASRSRAQIEGVADEFDSGEFRLSAYPMDNLRVSLAAGVLDLEDTYTFAVDYQPLLLTDTMSLLLEYGREERAVDSHFVRIGFAQRFGSRGNLIAIDRRYR